MQGKRQRLELSFYHQLSPRFNVAYGHYYWSKDIHTGQEATVRVEFLPSALRGLMEPIVSTELYYHLQYNYCTVKNS